MKEGIYIDEGKHQYHNVYTYVQNEHKKPTT